MDSGGGRRLERWGRVVLSRPDPQAIWNRRLPDGVWEEADAEFTGGAEGKGRWAVRRALPEPWTVVVGGCTFALKLTPFKHTGLFPEQAAQWRWLAERCRGAKNLKVLNLFGYTGGATVALAKAGCRVTHVDASKPAITWANENRKLNGIPETSVRWILDDAVKFLRRELRRGSRYDGAVMDPPAFGHGPSGQVWKFAQGMPELLKNVVDLLSPAPKFLAINGYATNSSAVALSNLLTGAAERLKGTVKAGELCLREEPDGRLLSTGIFARWSPK